MIIKTQDRFSSALLHTTMLSACLQHHVYPCLSPCSLPSFPNDLPHLVILVAILCLFSTHGNPMVWLVFLLPGTRYGRSTGIPCFFCFLLFSSCLPYLLSPIKVWRWRNKHSSVYSLSSARHPLKTNMTKRGWSTRRPCLVSFLILIDLSLIFIDIHIHWLIIDYNYHWRSDSWLISDDWHVLCIVFLHIFIYFCSFCSKSSTSPRPRPAVRRRAWPRLWSSRRQPGSGA